MSQSADIEKVQGVWRVLTRQEKERRLSAELIAELKAEPEIVARQLFPISQRRQGE